MEQPIPNLRHLGAYREVARLHSISKASQTVYLSQPAITQAISKLESQLDVALFERRADGMFSTEPGRLFLDRVERALDLVALGAREAGRLGGRRANRGFAHFEQLLTTAQLRALIAVSDAGNFSLAARSVGVSQPSLHRAARDLERLSGLALFSKTAQGIDLTAAARALAQNVKLAFAELEQGFTEVAEWQGVDTGTIVVGSMPLARSRVLPAAINTLTRERPDIRISAVDGPYADLLHGLRHGEIDVLIGALRDPLPIGDVVQEPLFDDALRVVGRAGHPLAGRRRVGLKDLAAYPWVVPRAGTPTRDHFKALFDGGDGTKPSGVIESSSLILIRGLLLDSDRLTLISGHQIEHEVEQGLLEPLAADLPDTRRPIGLTLRRDWRPTGAQARFLDAVREAGRAASSPGGRHGYSKIE
jgi:DNA-binding transcriptional LysR family regulator